MQGICYHAAMLRKLLSIGLLILCNIAPANDELALHLFRSVVQQAPTQNVVFSPASAEACLHALTQGAAGQSRAELKQVLSSSNASLKGSNVPVQQNIGIFADDTLPLKAGLSNITRIPLTQNRQKAQDVINAWFSKHTRGNLSQLLSGADALSPNCRMLVLSSIYLDASWDNVFAEADTYRSEFTRTDGSDIIVDMMSSGETELTAAGGKNWRAVALPYKNSAKAQRPIFFVAILTRGSAAQFAQRLTCEKLDIIRRKLAEKKLTVCVDIPKFTANSELMDLTQALKDKGLKLIFTDKADFSNWTNAKELWLSAVKQKAYVSITEQGTTAAAAGYAELEDECAAETLMFNKPFLWFIGELTPGSTPLFMGICENPLAN